MRCPSCNSENPEAAKFCGNCGKALGNLCANCGFVNPPQFKFCRECGTRHRAGSGSSSPTPAPAAQTTSTLTGLIERSSVGARNALEGERKTVTALFADIKESTALIQDLDPEEARAIIDPALRVMIDAVNLCEGYIVQSTGDGIFALFGAPVAYEDHPQRALYAALAMQQTLKEHADKLQAVGKPRVDIRVGVHTGEVVVRPVEAGGHTEYTPIGLTANLAARMETVAPAGGIVTTEETRRLVEGYFELRSLGPTPVKGVSAPVEAYEVIGPGRVRTHFQLAAERGLTKFVGRAYELAHLRRALDLAMTGRGQIVAAVGDAGAGKSRLIYEFKAHVPKGCKVLETYCVPHGRAPTYQAVLELLCSYFGIEREDHQEVWREKVSAKLAALDPTLKETQAYLFALLGIQDTPDPLVQIDAPIKRRRTLDAIKSILLRESLDQPLIVVFEDLHWIDEETQELLNLIGDSIGTARLLLLVNYRPAYSHAWGNKTYYAQLRLDPLGRDSADEMVTVLLGREAELVPLKQLIVEKVEGNPFFIEEIVQSLFEQAVIVRNGVVKLVKSMSEIRLPATVKGVLASRIDRLPPDQKELLQTLAVIGTRFSVALASAVSGKAKEDLARMLADLQLGEFIYEQPALSDVEYTFKHVLTHEVAYGSLLQDKRRILHARIVEAIELLYRDRLTEHVERLGYHAFRAEMWEKALTYLRRAGAKVYKRSANREAVRYFEQALSAMHHLPETREIQEQAIDLRFDFRNSLLPLGEFDRFYGYLREAEVLARNLGDQRRLGWTSVYLCHYLWMTGRSAEARVFGHNAYAISETIRDFQLTVDANFYLGLSCFASGDYTLADRFLRRTVQSLEGDLSAERCGLAGYPAAMSRSYLGLNEAYRGEFDAGLDHSKEGVRHAEDADHPYTRIVACWSLGSIYALRGDIDEGLRVLERALALCREWNLAVLSPLVAGPLGHVYALSGRVSEGLALLHEAMDAMELMGRGSYHSLVVVQLGEASVAAGRHDDALQFAERALALSRERGERGYQAMALQLLGEIVSLRTPLDIETAARHYGSAMALANNLGMRPLIARCHLGLSVLHRRTGKRREADEHLRGAATMLREMQMRFWLEKVEAELHDIAG